MFAFINCTTPCLNIFKISRTLTTNSKSLERPGRGVSATPKTVQDSLVSSQQKRKALRYPIKKRKNGLAYPLQCVQRKVGMNFVSAVLREVHCFSVTSRLAARLITWAASIRRRRREKNGSAHGIIASLAAKLRQRVVFTAPMLTAKPMTGSWSSILCLAWLARNTKTTYQIWSNFTQK